MITLVQEALQSRFVRFAIVGGIVFVIAFILLAFLVEFLRFNEIVANIITSVFALELNFLLNKYFNWKDRKGSFFSQWVKFHGVKGGIILFNQVVYIGLVSLGGHYLVIIVGLAAIETLISFLGNDKYIFKKDVL